MTFKSFLPIACAALMLSAGTLTTSQESFAAAAKKERSAKSLDCSKQADDKKLHGKARKTFRSKCMKG
jgi:psiF repeat